MQVFLQIVAFSLQNDGSGPASSAISQLPDKDKRHSIPLSRLSPPPPPPPLHHHHIKRLTRVQMRHLRQILNIKWQNKVPDTSVLQQECLSVTSQQCLTAAFPNKFSMHKGSVSMGTRSSGIKTYSRGNG